MRKHLAALIAGAVLILPGFALADTILSNSPLIQLYTQLIALLQQELSLLQGKGGVQTVALSPGSITGTAPLSVLFTLDKVTGKDAVDFGDGNSNWTATCTRNAAGWCVVSQHIAHTYHFPGTYYAVLIRGTPTTAVATSTITVTP